MFYSLAKPKLIDEQYCVISTVHLGELHHRFYVTYATCRNL